jgi:acyl-coenzyme A thioesterase PaaI-like protein
VVSEPAPLPEAFRDAFAGLEEQPVDPLFRGCFGCGPAHPDGLHVRCFRTAEGVAAPIVIARRYEGPPGTAHGGIVAACLDEVLGAAATGAAGRSSVTGELTVRYLKPAPIETPLLGLGRLVADHGRYLEVEGRLVELGTDRVLATARARFFPVATPEGSRR